jgi:hypothetical protein
LPPGVLEAANEKLYKGWEYPQVREWLFEQVAEEDVPALGLAKGEKFGLVWLRAAKSPANAGHFCQLALGTWYRARHPQWVREKILRGESMRVVKRAGVLTKEVVAGGPRSQNRGESAADADSDAQVSVEGGDILMRSVLIDAISSVEEGGKDRREIAQLANAWARLNQGKMESEKLRLKTEDSRKAAFDELGKDVRGNPEAMELFKKLRAVMSRSSTG